MDENKDNLKKRINRTTTSAQFQKLVDFLEACPHLASGLPSAQFGHTKATLEADWSIIAESLNTIGPPIRTVPEWKKTWSDLRSRTRLNIAEINKCDLYLTEGRWKPLSALELRVAKLCNLSTNPTALNNGVPKSSPVNRVVLVPPKLSSPLPTIVKPSSTSSIAPLPISAPKTVQKAKQKKISKQKRQAYIKELDLLRKQVTIQETMAGAMDLQVKSAEKHNKSLNEIAEACKLIANSMSDFIKQSK